MISMNNYTLETLTHLLEESRLGPLNRESIIQEHFKNLIELAIDGYCGNTMYYGKNILQVVTKDMEFNPFHSMTDQENTSSELDDECHVDQSEEEHLMRIRDHTAIAVQILVNVCYENEECARILLNHPNFINVLVWKLDRYTNRYKKPENGILLRNIIALLKNIAVLCIADTLFHESYPFIHILSRVYAHYEITRSFCLDILDIIVQEFGMKTQWSRTLTWIFYWMHEIQTSSPVKEKASISSQNSRKDEQVSNGKQNGTSESNGENPAFIVRETCFNRSPIPAAICRVIGICMVEGVQVPFIRKFLTSILVEDIYSLKNEYDDEYIDYVAALLRTIRIVLFDEVIDSMKKGIVGIDGDNEIGKSGASDESKESKEQDEDQDNQQFDLKSLFPTYLFDYLLRYLQNLVPLFHTKGYSEDEPYDDLYDLVIRFLELVSDLLHATTHLNAYLIQPGKLLTLFESINAIEGNPYFTLSVKEKVLSTRQIVRSICFLALDDEILQQLVHIDYIPSLLMRVIREKDDVLLVRNACIGFGNLARSKDNCMALVNIHKVHVLLTTELNEQVSRVVEIFLAEESREREKRGITSDAPQLSSNTQGKNPDIQYVSNLAFTLANLSKCKEIPLSFFSESLIASCHLMLYPKIASNIHIYSLDILCNALVRCMAPSSDTINNETNETTSPSISSSIPQSTPSQPSHSNIEDIRRIYGYITEPLKKSVEQLSQHGKKPAVITMAQKFIYLHSKIEDITRS